MPKGQCLCGEIRFSWEPPSGGSSHCHCSQCQYSHGAAVVSWVSVPTSDLTLEGREFLKWYASSESAQRGFCTNCGSSLFFKPANYPEEIHVTRANIAGDLDVEPHMHIYFNGEPSWFKENDGLPRYANDPEDP